MHPKYNKHMNQNYQHRHLGRKKCAGFWQISLYIILFKQYSNLDSNSECWIHFRMQFYSKFFFNILLYIVITHRAWQNMRLMFRVLNMYVLITLVALLLLSSPIRNLPFMHVCMPWKDWYLRLSFSITTYVLVTYIPSWYCTNTVVINLRE